MRVNIKHPDVVHVIHSKQYSGKPVLVCCQCQGVIFDHSIALVGWQTKNSQIVDGRVYCVHKDCRKAFEDKAQQWQPGREWFWLSAREFVWLMSDGLGLLTLKKQTSRKRYRGRK